MSEEESSVLFSLKELMSIEEDRIKTEEHDRVAQAAEADRARLEAERIAREAEEARVRAEEERRRVEEQRRREEQVRLDAIQQGELEKARTEAEQRARLEAMTAQQAHERQLAQLSQDKGKKNMKLAIILGAAVVVLGGSLGGYMFYRNSQENEARIAAEQREKERLKEEAETERKKREEQITSLEDKLASLAAGSKEAEALRDEIKKLKESQPEEGTTPTRRGVGPRTGTGGPGTDPKPAPKPTCPPGDPLCSDIGG